jgi:hypothetical protein
MDRTAARLVGQSPTATNAQDPRAVGYYYYYYYYYYYIILSNFDEGGRE